MQSGGVVKATGTQPPDRKAAGAKGQILSLEIILSFSFFLAAVLIFAASWNAIYDSYTNEAQLRQMQTSVVGIGDMLVMSQGDPEDWEFGVLENATSIGTASSPGILSAQKLSALQSLNASHYDTLRERMGAGPADIYLEVQTVSGSPLYAFGIQPDLQNGSVNTVGTERLALLDGELVKVKVQSWRGRQ